MLIWGISALNHDASISVVDGNDILFAAHSERYSKVKNDTMLNANIVSEALVYGVPDKVVWFERPLLKKTRQIYSGEWHKLSSISPREYLAGFFAFPEIEYVDHHSSHACGGYFTSPFDEASILVIDGIGEWATTTIWEVKGSELKKRFKKTYPDSIGLFYSAMTHRVGLKPNEEEYIFMGMAAYGKPRFVEQILEDLLEFEGPEFSLKRNLHIGCMDWLPDDLETDQAKFDLAASAQLVVEQYLTATATWIAKNLPSKNLIISGGVALNCVANEKIAELGLFDDIWIMPNPGDAGSSLGAIAAYTHEKLNWKTPYLGTNIDRPFNTAQIIEEIRINKIAAIANGRAEFGPRALGNRSLIADPRGHTIKDEMNSIKQRQKFRPFAPMILEEHAHRFFELPVATSPYMQFTAKCKRPDLYPAICHVDGSSRVQTVNRQQNEKIYRLLTEFYNETGCPMLVNTSLNIKGQPLVNTWHDALDFNRRHRVRVF